MQVSESATKQNKLAARELELLRNELQERKRNHQMTAVKQEPIYIAASGADRALASDERRRRHERRNIRSAPALKVAGA